MSKVYCLVVEAYLRCLFSRAKEICIIIIAEISIAPSGAAQLNKKQI